MTPNPFGRRASDHEPARDSDTAWYRAQQDRDARNLIAMAVKLLEAHGYRVTKPEGKP